MYVSRSEEDGVLHGWLHDGSVDVFVWFEGDALTQAQICAGRHLVEWTAPSRLTTGQVREAEKNGRLLAPGAGIIDFDRKPQMERIEAIRAAVQRSGLTDDVKGLVAALLERNAPQNLVHAVEMAVLRAPGS